MFLGAGRMFPIASGYSVFILLASCGDRFGRRRRFVCCVPWRVTAIA